MRGRLANLVEVGGMGGAGLQGRLVGLGRVAHLAVGGSGG